VFTLSSLGGMTGRSRLLAVKVGAWYRFRKKGRQAVGWIPCQAKMLPRGLLQNPILFSFFFSVSLLFLINNFKLNFKTTFELVKLFPLFGELQGDFLK
jgi:hypothetical protein